MSAVAVHLISITRRSKRKAALTNQRRAIIAIDITPDAVDLACISVIRLGKAIGTIYQLVTTNNGHDAQRMYGELRRIKVRVSGAASRITEYDIRDIVRIQVADSALRVELHFGLEGSLGLGIRRSVASSVSRISLVAVAVDVHVRKVCSVAVKIYRLCRIVLTIGER
jgi:hypothetical protein